MTTEPKASLGRDGAKRSAPKPSRETPDMSRVHSRDALIPTAEASEPVVTQWLRSGEYLPDFMRDFHDQKDLFKAVDEVKQRSVERNGGSYMRDLSWSDAHVYTVDIFLWMMARHGYTLQRSRKRGVTFPDVNDFVAAAVKRSREASAALLFSRATTASSVGTSACASEPNPTPTGSKP